MSRIPALCVLFCLPFLSWLLSQNASPTGAPRPKIILITIDTLRYDYLGSYGNTKIKTPTLDALAKDGTLFERAYCQAPMTPPSHASILTGAYPPTHGVRDFTSPGLRKGFPTLAGILSKNGYKTAAFVSAYVLDRVWGLDQGFDVYYDHFNLKDFQGVNPGNVQRKAGETIGLVLEWLEREARGSYFLWLHLYDPHHDYNPPEPFRSRYPGDRYGGEVAYADSELGRLIDALKRRGDYDEALIVATSDHGEAFGEHEESEHGFFLYETTTRIPLIVKLPRGLGPPSRTVPGAVETVDIAPTILQVAAISGDPHTPMQGKGLLSQILVKTAPAKNTAYSETYYPRNTFGWSELSAYIDGRYKYIEAPRPELYDLTADPGETENLYLKQRALGDSLRTRLVQLQQRTTSAANPAPAGPDPQRIEALRALGYVAVTVPLQRKPGQAGLIDPKDRVRTFNKILLGMQAADAGAFGKSDALLGEVVREDPDLFIAHYSLGVNKLKTGENEKALEYFSRAKSLNPDFDLTDMNRASALARLNRLDEAIAVLQEVLRRLPSRLEAKRQLGLLYSRKKDHLKAIATYQDILSSRPEDAEATKYLGLAQVDAERYEEGSASLRTAIARGAEDALAYNFLGIALGNTGKREEAIAAYRKALAIKQDYYQARLNLSFALLRSGQEAEARKEFSTLCKANPRLCDPYRKYFP